MSLTLSLFAPSAPPVEPPTTTGPAEWSGHVDDQTLIVNVEVVYPGGTNYAPLNVEFRTTVVNSAVGAKPPIDGAFDPTFQGITCVILTGDSGLFKNERVTFNAHRNKAYAFGTRAPFVYSNPGSYTAYVFAYDRFGRWGVSVPITINVLEPNSVFSAAHTIVVDPDGVFDGAPAHDEVNNRFTTLTDAILRFNAINNFAATRICCKAGSSFNEIAPSPLFKYTKDRALFTIYGGTTPISYSERGIQGDGSKLSAFFKHGGYHAWAVQGWNFDFGWDVHKDAPSAGWDNVHLRKLHDSVDDRRHPADLIGFRPVYDNCEIKGCAGAVLSAASIGYTKFNSAWFLKDCVFKENADYIAFSGSSIYMLGCEVLESVGENLNFVGRYRLGGIQRGGRGHRSIRNGGTYHIYIRATFMEARGGWTGSETARGWTFYSPQPMFRTNNQGKGVDGFKFHILDSVMLRTIGLPSGAPISNSIVENTLVIIDPAQSTADEFINKVRGGCTVRNCMFIALNTPKLSKSDLLAMGRNTDQFELNNGNMTIGQYAGEAIRPYGLSAVDDPFDGQLCEVLNVTVAMLRSENNISGGQYLGFMPDAYTFSGQPIAPAAAKYIYVSENHVEYCPRLSNPIGLPMEMLNFEGNGIRVLDVWMKMHWVLAEHTNPDPIPPGGTTGLIPYPKDWANNQTNQAYFSQTDGNHGLKAKVLGAFKTFSSMGPKDSANGAPNYYNGISIEFQSGGFILTNTSPETIDANQLLSILLNCGVGMPVDVLFQVPQEELKLYRPVTPVPVDAGTYTPMFDMSHRLRPNAGYAISPTEGVNCKGALLPA